MIKRSEKVAYMEVIEGTEKVYKRMTGFTEFAVSKNPKEYSRKYVDEDIERSEVVSYSTAISYKFDLERGNPVHDFLSGIAEGEYVGEDALCSIIVVDLYKKGSDTDGVKAIKRTFTVVPENEGDDSDTYTVSGSLRAIGASEFGLAKSTDKWQTITFEKM